MSKNPLVYLNISLIVLVLWLLLKPQPAPVSSIDNQAAEQLPSMAEINQLKQRIAALEQDLNLAIAERINLEQSLQTTVAVASTEPTARADSDSFDQMTIIDPVAPITIDAEQVSVEEQLSAAGMPTETIQAMQQSIDQSRLQMLQLRDRASREGWDDSDEYRDQMRDLRNPYRGLRDEFGDEAFDQFLFASGIPNRVQVEEVYSGSAADDAGLVPGDIIVSYAETTIYSMTTLRDSTLEGFAGENILLEVNRDGQPITINVPRGPLGISMSSTVIRPDSMQ